MAHENDGYPTATVESPVTETFLYCAVCGHSWPSRESFLGDSLVELIGYQANFVDLIYGLFLFNHSCNTTLSVMVQSFNDLYHGRVFPEPATGSDACSGFCLHQENLGRCPTPCKCAYVREIVQIICQWPKANPALHV
jgi:hypothetical protein